MPATRACTWCWPAAVPRRRRCASRLGEHATFLGWLSGTELARVYASADVFMFASRTDTFGQVVLEAQASGLPVIAVAEGGPLSLIEHGETGLLCDANAEQSGGGGPVGVRQPAACASDCGRGRSARSAGVPGRLRWSSWRAATARRWPPRRPGGRHVKSPEPGASGHAGLRRQVGHRRGHPSRVVSARGCCRRRARSRRRCCRCSTSRSSSTWSRSWSAAESRGCCS